MMKLNILVSEVEGKLAVCFNTGLDSHSFARTKMSQSLIEKGFIVYPDGKHETWKALGVNEINGYMTVWGQPFAGKRLDQILNDESIDQQTALQAVVYWIRAKLFLGETHSTPNPGAAFICLSDNQSHPTGSVFFAPENLSNRCLLVEEMENTGKTRPSDDSLIAPDYFNCPDFKSMEAVAFCAGVMLYMILAKNHPYPSRETIFQDMREGVFIPMHVAAPGLDKELAALIQCALMMPVNNRKSAVNGIEIVSEFQNLLINKENPSEKTEVVSVSSLFSEVTPEQNEQLEKEKKSFLNKKNKFVKSKRYVIRNRTLLTGLAICLIVGIIIITSAINNYNRRPTTAGMTSNDVVTSYFEAFGAMDHIFMEACIQGANRDDINTAAQLFVISRQRQATEMIGNPFTPAQKWRDSGEQLPAFGVFGITDMTIEYLSGSDDEGVFSYRVNYWLWSPDEYGVNRTDILTLNRDRRGNWRITEILRTSKEW